VILDVARRLTREIELGGYRIPAGSLLVPSIAATHYREDLYPSPDEFRPERFLDKPPDGYTWLPFGGGVRRCIGASFAQFEMRVIMRAILERADLRAARPAPERARLRNITVAPARGCRVVLVRPPAPPRERVSEAAGSSADPSSSRTAATEGIAGASRNTMPPRKRCTGAEYLAATALPGLDNPSRLGLALALERQSCCGRRDRAGG
jgi:hypothetical protein